MFGGGGWSDTTGDNRRNRKQHLIEFYALVNLTLQYLVIKKLCCRYVEATDRHEVSCGLFARAELLVLISGSCTASPTTGVKIPQRSCRFPFRLPPFSSPPFSLPLKSVPLNPARVTGQHCKLTQGVQQHLMHVWLQIASGKSNCKCIFTKINANNEELKNA